MTRAQHWDKIYSARAEDEVSWFVPHLETSLRLIGSAQLDPATAEIIDVGGGRSTLVDDLVERGYRHVTVLDISAAAIEQTKEKLGERAAAVT